MRWRFGLLALLYACDKDAPVDTGADTDTGVDTDTGADTDTGGDTDTDAETTLITAVTRDCEVDPDPVTGSNWDYTVETDGPSSGVLMTVTQDTNEAWEETHDLTGTSTTLTVSLVGANSDSTQEQNVSTAFSCGMESLMVWRYDLYDPVDNTVIIDCVVASGSETSPDVIWGSDLDGCSNANDWI